MSGLRAKPPKQAKQRRPRILVYGPAGVGKTWTCLDFPSVYFADTEAGATQDHYIEKLTKSGGVYLGQEDGASDMDVLLSEIQMLAKTPHEYRTLVIDSFTKAFQSCVQAEYDRMSSKPGKDMTKTFGAEKKPAVAKTKQMIAWFSKLDMNVILVCHEKAKYVDDVQAGVTFDGHDKLDYELDLALHIVRQGNARKAKVTKSRLLGFKEGELVDWRYETFAERYGKAFVEAPHKPIEPATPSQIGEMVGLASKYKLDEALKAKWFEKAGVDDWSQMDFDTISKCINYFTKGESNAV
jgi:hypothetical protein